MLLLGVGHVPARFAFLPQRHEDTKVILSDLVVKNWP